jgi:hypothetical protein
MPINCARFTHVASEEGKKYGMPMVQTSISASSIYSDRDECTALGAGAAVLANVTETDLGRCSGFSGLMRVDLVAFAAHFTDLLPKSANELLGKKLISILTSGSR